MVTAGAFAYGTALKKGGIAGDAIAELTNINGLNLTSDEIDLTNHQSPGGFEEVIQGINRSGEVNIEGNFIAGDGAGQRALYNDYLIRAIDDYAIVFPAATCPAVWTFKAFVKGPPATSAPVEGKIPFTATLRVTGESSLDIDASVFLTALAVTDGTVVPAFAGATVFDYVSHVAAATCTFTVTFAAGVCTLTCGAQVQVLTSTEASTAVTLGGATSLTDVYISVKETGKMANVYHITVERP